VDVAQQAVSDATAVREPRAVRVFCLAILALALAIGAALVALGAALPAPGPVLLLALVVALCVNRFALFPSEQAATAEAAVLLAAVVAVRGSALWLGPLCVALLVGPLDSLHWHQRSFLRMAYNAGNRGLAVVVAVAGFVGVRELTGRSTTAVVVGAVVAAACFAVVDLFLSAALLLLQGNSRAAALRHVLDIDALTLPVALYGGAAGLLVSGPGWWATALALIPAAFVPELVLTRIRWRGAIVRDLVLALVVVAGLVSLAVVGSLPDALTLALLVAVGVLAGLEFGADARAAVPPLLAVGVVAAVVVADGDRAFFAAALVAVVGTWTALLVSSIECRVGAPVALITAAVGGTLAALIYEVAPRSVHGVAWPALTAGLGFELVAVAVATDRRRTGRQVLWSAPVLATAVAAAFTWRLVGPGGAVLFAFVMTAVGAATTWWGAPPWRSRVLSARLVGWPPTRHRVVQAGTAGIAVLLMGVALVGRPGVGREVLVWVGVALGEIAVAMALAGVRQWRFAPRRRASECATLLLVTLLLIVVCPSPLVAGEAWPMLLSAALLAVVVVIGARHARHADRASHAAGARPRR
jgi:hypothetical protein